MTRIGFSLQAQYSQPMTQVIAMLSNSGFSAVSPVWSPECDLTSLSACVRRHNIMVQSLHAPHKGISSLWQPDSLSSVQVQKNVIACVDACNEFEIPIMVLHGWQGLIYTFPTSPLDYRFFDQLVEHAQKQGVTVAFENLEGEEYLQALMARYPDLPHIGFCWDSGHDHCYPHKTDFLEAYGDRLIMTHLNDNLGLRDPGGIPSGMDDLHFLPYDGNINWNHAIDKLKNAAKQHTLNFEFKTHSHSRSPPDLIYTPLSLEQFLHTAGNRAREITKLYETTPLVSSHK